uniref:non-specific serine/threonine protein kinase n=1 Tax=Ornithorhynchus anatinus TaxID=9258 RepID=A0A6I8NBZ6_ORNAN
IYIYIIVTIVVINNTGSIWGVRLPVGTSGAPRQNVPGSGRWGEPPPPPVAPFRPCPFSPPRQGAAAGILAQLRRPGPARTPLPEEWKAAATYALSAPAELHVTPPDLSGFFDGLLLLLLRLVSEGEADPLRDLPGSALWTALWHRLSVTLRLPSAPDAAPPPPGPAPADPDWTLISPRGLVTVLNLALCVFTKEAPLCLHVLAQPRGHVLASLGHLLDPAFLLQLSRAPRGSAALPAVVLTVCQILCVPFALDEGGSDHLAGLLAGLNGSHVAARLLQVCCEHLPLAQTDLPVSLLTRLALSDPASLGQFVAAASSLPASSSFLSAALLGDRPPLTSDLLSLLARAVRPPAAGGPPFLQALLAGPGRTYRPLRRLLGHRDSPVRARACVLLGHTVRHGGPVLRALGERGGLLAPLLRALEAPDPALRRSATFALGSAARRAGPLAPRLAPAVPGLTRLLGDPQAPTRRHAASALGRLGPGGLGGDLLRCRAPHRLLDVARRDPQPAVQEAALLALRVLGRDPAILQVLASLGAKEKLTALGLNEARSQSTVAKHCRKFLILLRAAPPPANPPRGLPPVSAGPGCKFCGSSALQSSPEGGRREGCVCARALPPPDSSPEPPTPLLPPP